MITQQDLMLLIDNHSKHYSNTSDYDTDIEAKEINDHLSEMYDKLDKLHLLNELLSSSNVELKMIVLKEKEITAKQWIEEHYKEEQFKIYEQLELDEMIEKNIILCLCYTTEMMPYCYAHEYYYGASLDLLLSRYQMMQ